MEKKENKERLEKNCLHISGNDKKNFIYALSNYSRFYQKALTIFDISTDDIDFESIGSHNYLKAGDNIKKIEILFKKVEIQND